jgi:hypothetical protein
LQDAHTNRKLHCSEDKENESWYNELAVKTKEMKATRSLPIIHVNKIIFCHKWFGVA